jgi:hypothetical protein
MGINIDIRYGLRFARRSELEIDDIKLISGNTKYQKKFLIDLEPNDLPGVAYNFS